MHNKSARPDGLTSINLSACCDNTLSIAAGDNITARQPANRARKQHSYLVRLLVLVTVAVSIFIISGCSGISKSKTLSTGPAQTYDDLEAGRMQGTVSAEANGNPLKGAIIETFEKQAVADETGQYLLGPIPAGDYRVIARASGYSLGVKDDVRVLSGRITENVNFRLPAQTDAHAPDFAVMALVPFYGTDGDTITVYCKGCGKNKGQVTFNGKSANIIDWNSQLDDRIVVQAPAEVETGPVRVIINGETSKETQPQQFIGKPVILRAEPTIAQGGQLITIYGRNFNPIDRFNRVKLKGADCMVTAVIDDKTLQVQLPVNAQTGLLSIRIESNEYQLDGISSQIITIKPILVHISPKRAIPGVPLTLYGYNFGDNRNNVKILFGTYEIAVTANDSFSDNKIIIKVPDNTVLAAGATSDVKVKVNAATSNALRFTAYNTANVTLSAYGMYDFSSSAVSSGGTLRIKSLAPTDRIAFLSVLSGDGTQDLDGDFYYSFTGYLGGNFDLIPVLPGSMRASTSRARLPLQTSNSSLVGPYVTAAASVRAAMNEPASPTISLYFRNYSSADPWDYNNDILATATLKASSTRALVYYDSTLTGLTDNDATAIAEEFDKIYANLATACWDGLTRPPEGNIDDQPRIAIVVTPTLDAYRTAEGRMLVTSFDPRDKDPNQPNSAGTEMIYANPVGYTQNRANFYGGLAYSLSTMMYLNQKAAEATPWQNAGIGVFARQVAGYGFTQSDPQVVGYVSQYLQHAETVSLNHWPEDRTDANFGMQYLFTQYLFDHCGGYSAISQLEKTDPINQYSGLEDVNNDLVTGAYTDFPKVSMREFFHNFCKALYCDDLGLVAGFIGYNKERHQFKNISLRGKVSGVDGLRGTLVGEPPVTTRIMPIKGYGCSVIEYSQGNWGDLEVTIDAMPSAGNFKTWVIYYSAEQIASSTIGQ